MEPIDDVDLEVMGSSVEREGLLPVHLAFMLLKELRSAKAEIKRLQDERSQEPSG